MIARNIIGVHRTHGIFLLYAYLIIIIIVVWLSCLSCLACSSSLHVDGGSEHIFGKPSQHVTVTRNGKCYLTTTNASAHIAQANAKTNYLMNNTVLLSTESEKDVGVIVSSDMKVPEQCGIAARKGNQILGFIRRNIAHRDKRLIIPL